MDATEATEKIAAAVLYEGYMLWPYRRGTTKNQQRWTFGGVYPRAYSEAPAGSDPWLVQTECLVSGEAPVLDVTVRFLHLVARRVGQRTPDGTLEFVDVLQLGAERYLAWEEATEREVPLTVLRLADLQEVQRFPFGFPAGHADEPLIAPTGEVVGALVREWRALSGVVEVAAQPVDGGLTKITLRIQNTSAWAGADRASALRHTLVSTHALLRVAGGEFLSLMDPPPQWQSAAEACQQIKLWPVLVGAEGDRHTMLAAPIILYDYPQVAPESPGDLFDATEIDQLLIMNVLTLTDEEKAEMRATDPRTREILERAEALTKDDFLRLHGAIREFQVLRPQGEMPPPLFAEMEAPSPERVTIGGAELTRGSKVRLRPRPGGDIFDLALAGRVAFIEAIEQDYEGALHLAVTLEDDPGRDLGQERQIGHRFFFSPEEIEPLEDAIP